MHQVLKKFFFALHNVWGKLDLPILNIDSIYLVYLRKKINDHIYSPLWRFERALGLFGFRHSTRRSAHFQIERSTRAAKVYDRPSRRNVVSYCQDDPLDFVSRWIPNPRLRVPVKQKKIRDELHIFFRVTTQHFW